MTDNPDFPGLAPIRRRSKPDRGATGRAAPRRVLTTVEVEVETFDPVARVINTHKETARAYVRELPAALSVLPAPLREAALAYAKAVEDVAAGGAADPAAKAAKGSPAVRKEGRQFHAVRQVEHLRRLEAAVGPGALRLGRRRDCPEGVEVTRLSILRAVAVDGLSVAGLLAALRLGRSAARQKLVLGSLLASVEAVAGALDREAADKKIGSPKKRD